MRRLVLAALAASALLCAIPALAGSSGGSSTEAAAAGGAPFDVPPTTCYLCDEFENSTPSKTWTGGNVDASTLTYAYDMAYFNGGDSTNEWHGYCLDTTAYTMPGAVDQSFCIKLSQFEIDTTNDQIGIAVIGGGTISTPTELQVFGPGNFSTDGIINTEYTSWALAGSSSIGSYNIDAALVARAPLYLNVSYTAATGVTTPSYPFDGTSWWPLGVTGNLSGVPVTWCIGGRSWPHGYINFARLRVDANRLRCGE